MGWTKSEDYDTLATSVATLCKALGENPGKLSSARANFDDRHSTRDFGYATGVSEIPPNAAEALRRMLKSDPVRQFLVDHDSVISPGQFSTPIEKSSSAIYLPGPGKLFDHELDKILTEISALTEKVAPKVISPRSGNYVEAYKEGVLNAGADPLQK